MYFTVLARRRPALDVRKERLVVVQKTIDFSLYVMKLCEQVHGYSRALNMLYAARHDNAWQMIAISDLVHRWATIPFAHTMR